MAGAIQVQHHGVAHRAGHQAEAGVVERELQQLAQAVRVVLPVVPVARPLALNRGPAQIHRQGAHELELPLVLGREERELCAVSIKALPLGLCDEHPADDSRGVCFLSHGQTTDENVQPSLNTKTDGIH